MSQNVFFKKRERQGEKEKSREIFLTAKAIERRLRGCREGVWVCISRAQSDNFKLRIVPLSPLKLLKKIQLFHRTWGYLHPVKKLKQISSSHYSNFPRQFCDEMTLLYRAEITAGIVIIAPVRLKKSWFKFKFFTRMILFWNIIVL